MERAKRLASRMVSFVAWHWTCASQKVTNPIQLSHEPAEVSYITLDGKLRANTTTISWEIAESKAPVARLAFAATCHEIGRAPVDLVDAMREKKPVEVDLLFGTTGRRLYATCYVEHVSYTCGVSGERGLVYRLVGHTHGRFK